MLNLFEVEHSEEMPVAGAVFFLGNWDGGEFGGCRRVGCSA